MRTSTLKQVQISNMEGILPSLRICKKQSSPSVLGSNYLVICNSNGITFLQDILQLLPSLKLRMCQGLHIAETPLLSV